MKDFEGLKKVIEKHISYDGDGGERCPHCKMYIKQPLHWLDHKWTLANYICEYMGYPEIFVSRIEELLQDEIEYVSGNPKKDSEVIATIIFKEA
ncbi:MAG: hypothetical protein KKB38_20935 [Gammaproteobacteria bacterium]|nr:hypothetical protein [Gammaproteobacteria bacterium]